MVSKRGIRARRSTSRAVTALITAGCHLWSLAPHRVLAGEADHSEQPLRAEVSTASASSKLAEAEVAGDAPSARAGGNSDGAVASTRAAPEPAAASALKADVHAAAISSLGAAADRPQKLVTGADKTGVSSQAISVPQGAGKIQGMGESFSAQLSTGIATFSVPFALPTARGGVQPSLGLSYSSSSGHGVAGVGWDIGVPSISRQSDRGVPKYDDPPSGGKWHPEQDRFIFNGGQELVPICLVGSDCTPGKTIQPDEVMPSWAKGYQYFRPRVEGGFQRFFWSFDHRTWIVEDKSGSTLELGVAQDEPLVTGALETDPGNPSKIYRWNLVRQYDAQRKNDGAGNPQPVNMVRYRYTTVDSVAYLTDIFDTTPAAAPTSTSTAAYAHHTRLVYEPRPDPTFSYQRGWRAGSSLRLERVDVTSATFAASGARRLVRRYHLTYDSKYHVSLLDTVQMEGRCGYPGTGEENEPVQEDMSQALPDATSCPRLPAMKFGYTHVTGYSTTGTVATSDLVGYEPFDGRIRAMAASPPHSIDEELTDLFDVNADGLPDVIVTDPASYGGAHGVYFNGDQGKADAFRADTILVDGVNGDTASVLTLRNPNLTVSDIDGNGVANLVHMPLVNTYSVYDPKFIPGGTSGHWHWVGRPVTISNPKIDFGKDASDIHVMDVNGDGLVDVVRTTGTEVDTYLSLGRYPGGNDRYGNGIWTSGATANLTTAPITACVPWSALPVRFSDADTRVADMNGDGLPDIVRVENGGIRYWPGRGNGVWGTGPTEGCTAGTFGSGTDIQMTSSPVIPGLDMSSIRLDDVNGDGLDDLVQVRFSDVDVWLNVDGAGWTPRHTISGTPAAPGYTSRVRLVDVNGSGTRDILWGDGLAYKYIDLQGGERPWLLNHVENGLGKSTDIDYASSTTLMQAAKGTADEWTSVAPLPLHVVVRETERDNLASLGRPAGVYVTEYEYANPLYDGIQREFRGFAKARAKRIGDANSPTAITSSEFVLGECWTDEGACTFENRWKDNQHEALKGLPAISETYDTANVYLSTLHHQYTLTNLYSGLDGRGVWWAYESQTDSWLYDTGPFTPDGTPLPIDDVVGGPGVGIPSRSLRARGARSVHLQSNADARSPNRGTPIVDNFGNSLRHEDDGSDVDEVITSYTVPKRIGDWLWRTERSYVVGADGVHRHETKTTYDDVGNPIETRAMLAGSLELRRQRPDCTSAPCVADTPAVASKDDVTTGIWQASTSYDSFGQVVNASGAGGRYREVDFDNAYHDVPIAERVYVGGGRDAPATPSDRGTTVLEARVFAFDRGLGAIREVRDIHQEATRVAYDGFGRTVSLSKPSPTTPGVPSGYASVEITYKLPPETGKPYSLLETFVQIGNDESSSLYRHAYAYVDGLGRTMLTIDEADKANGDADDWIVNGLTEYDAKGAASRAYRGWFWHGDPENYPLSTAPTSKYGRQRYDAFGRQIQTFGLDGTVTLQSVYHALSTDAWDAADLSPGPHFGTYASAAKDGHGRSVSAIERAHAGGAIEARETITEYLPSGEVAKIRRRVVGSSTEVVRWMRYDTLGRMVLNVEPNTTADYSSNPADTPNHAWRYAYDDAGDLVGTSDARGCGVNYAYDFGGRLVGEDYSPCEAQHAPYSKPDWTTDSGFEVRYHYDYPDADVPSDAANCTYQTLTAQNGATTRVPSSSWSLGRLVSVSDRGAKTITNYDGRGRTTCIARKLMSPDGTGYVDDWYVQTAAYDNADRTIAADTGAKSPQLMGPDDASRVTTSFTKRGTVLDVAGSYGTLASEVIHDADGLPQSITYGDVAKTKTDYSYDDRLRLKNVITYRGPPTAWTSASYAPSPTYNNGIPSVFQLVLQNYDYTYDAVDNPTEIRDWRIPNEWPAGSKPVSRKIEYDDLYRVSKVDYAYTAGFDTWVSPFDAENTGAATDPKLAKPSPQISFDQRVLWQSFSYDWLGNTVQTGDDAHGFYDRSLGTITNDTDGNKPYQLKSASNEGSGSTRAGHLSTVYDAAGNLTSMAVQRKGTCLPAGATCSQRFAYEWDEAGRLVHARRWDLANAGLASDATPTGTAVADLTYAYDSGDQRVRKTATDANSNQLHTLYPFASLEVRRTSYDGTRYDRSAQTEVPYLLAHGVRLGRGAYEPSDVPTLADPNGFLGGQLHVFLELADHLGSTSIVIDKGTSELVEAGTYQAYGGAESDYRPGRWKNFREDHRFTGKEEDVEVGLHYFGFRYYAPQLGRWVSADPLAVHGLGADLNVYAYVHGKLLSATDPVGLEDKKAEENGKETWDASRGKFGICAVDPDTDRVLQKYYQENPQGGWKPLDTGSASTDQGGTTLDEERRKLQVQLDAFGAAAGTPLGAAASIAGLSPEWVAAIGSFNLVVEIGAHGATGRSGGDEGVLNSEAEVQANVQARIKQWKSEGLDVEGDSFFERPPPSWTQDPAAATERCFVPGTLVLLADGSAKPIDAIVPGDVVVTDNPTDSQSPSIHSVAATRMNWSEGVVRIEILDGHQSASFEATREHPIWTQGSGWVAAKDVQVGDILLDVKSAPLVVTATSLSAKTTLTYNLSVDGSHTFFIVVGGQTVLVHNETPLDAPGYWNYTLKDSDGKVYYSGMAGPNETEADVKYRHADTGRYAPGADVFVRTPGTRTYGEARVMEHQTALLYQTYTGRTPEYRGNRQNPIGPRNQGKYFPNGGYEPCH